MKRNLFLIAISAILIMTGCSKESTLTINGQEVSKAIVEAFNKQYPGATNVKWNKRASYTIATFTLPGTKSDNIATDTNTNSAWYDDAANCLMTELDKNVNELPTPVKTVIDSLMRDKYPTYKVDDIDMISRDGHTNIYVFEIEGKDANGKESEIDLYISEEGILVREVIDIENDDDDDDKYDSMISNVNLEKFNAILTQKYGEFTLVEADIEDNGSIEIEILIKKDNKCIKLEVVFGKNGEFIYDSYEIDLKNAPKAIIEYINANYTDGEVEELEIKTTAANQIFYIFEYEIEEGNVEKEITVVLQINENGEVVEIKNK